MLNKISNIGKRLFSNKEEDFTLQVNTIAIFGILAVVTLAIFFIVLNSNSPVPTLPTIKDSTSVISK